LYRDIKKKNVPYHISKTSWKFGWKRIELKLVMIFYLNHPRSISLWQPHNRLSGGLNYASLFARPKSLKKGFLQNYCTFHSQIWIYRHILWYRQEFWSRRTTRTAYLRISRTYFQLHHCCKTSCWKVYWLLTLILRSDFRAAAPNNTLCHLNNLRAPHRNSKSCRKWLLNW